MRSRKTYRASRTWVSPTHVYATVDIGTDAIAHWVTISAQIKDLDQESIANLKAAFRLAETPWDEETLPLF